MKLEMFFFLMRRNGEFKYIYIYNLIWEGKLEEFSSNRSLSLRFSEISLVDELI